MSLRLRLVLLTTLFLSVGYYFFIDWLREELNTQYAYLVEDNLIDTAYLLSSAIEKDLKSSDGEAWDFTFVDQYLERRIDAKIYEKLKTSPSIGVYIVDKDGIVRYSTRKSEVGKDFSQWNDVYLALQGKYGARSTRVDPNDPESSEYFITAPISTAEGVVGAVSVIKSEQEIISTTSHQLQTILSAVGFLFAVLIVLSLFVSFWFTRPIERLKDYALRISKGQKVLPPKLATRELSDLLVALETMRDSIDGHALIEDYTKNLTHELKSPLTAITGAAELSLEDMEPDRRQKFLKNILQESSRARDLLDQLLRISTLESQKYLETKESVDFHELVQDIQKSLSPQLERKRVELEVSGTLEVAGNRFLCSQALRNLIENALDFCHEETIIQVRLLTQGVSGLVQVENSGPNVPEYALRKVFDKFFSLERPETGRKSTGLGLALVHQILLLHQGSVYVENISDPIEGVVFTMSFPLS